jgi:hypothetical protein
VGRVHLEALRRVEFVDVAAIAGRELASAKRLGAGFGVETVVDDYRKLLEDATIDAIHICTPNATHYQMAKMRCPLASMFSARSPFPSRWRRHRNWSLLRKSAHSATASAITYGTTRWFNKFGGCERMAT